MEDILFCQSRQGVWLHSVKNNKKDCGNVQMSFRLQIETECIGFYGIERTIGIEYCANEHVNCTFWNHSMCNQWSITEQGTSVYTLLLHFVMLKSLLEISKSRMMLLGYKLCLVIYDVPCLLQKGQCQDSWLLKIV